MKKVRKQLKIDSVGETTDHLFESDANLNYFREEELPTKDKSTQTVSSAELNSKIERLLTTNELKDQALK